MPPLPVFHFDRIVTAEDGREDKITMQLGAWAISCTNDTIPDFKEYLALPPMCSRDDPAVVPRYGWIFNRPSEARGGWGKMQIRTNEYEQAPRGYNGTPLFSGHMLIHRERNPHPLLHTLRARLNLTLNPMRYVRHQDRPRFPLGHHSTWPQPSLVKRNLNTEGGEFSLDGNDNWIPASGPIAAY